MAYNRQRLIKVYVNPGYVVEAQTRDKPVFKITMFLPDLIDRCAGFYQR